MNTFNHLHLHTRYSLNDAMINAKGLAKKCKEYGMDAVAITEHGHLMNMPEAYLALKDEGIKLIVGMEAYESPTLNTMKKERGSHLVLLCENNTGYQNLLKIASDAAINGYYYNPRTDKEKLRQYHEGLICSSACLGGSINKFLLNGDYESAKKEALEYQDIFGVGNFFLEIQRHGLAEQDQINPLIIRLSRDTGIPLIATNDSHYLNPEDWEAHDIQMAIQAKTTIHDTKRKVYTSHEFYFKSQEEMTDLFKDLPEACENTVKIANRCNVEIDFDSSKLPPFKVPDDYTGTNSDLLREMTLKGLKELYGELGKEQLDRMDFELSVVEKMGFVNYFLITWDVFRFCKDGTYEIGQAISDEWKPILVGPGRGSGAGSIMLYGLGITKIDPLKHDLLFQRFLNPDRISMPDIDSDFESTRRQEVIDYVVYKYGRDSICQIVTMGTLAARAAIRKVGKALDYPISLYDKISKMVPGEVGITLKKALQMSQDLHDIYVTDKRAKEIIDFSMKLEGLPTNLSTHAAGVLITDGRGVSAHVPMYRNDSGIVAQYDKNILERMNLLKMDFLGLKTLGILGEAKRMVELNHGVEIDFDELYKIKDLKPLELIRAGNTECLFQVSGEGMKAFLMDLQPTNIEDIILGISIYRPGPMDSIPQLLNNKRNPDKIHYPFPELEQILKPTYGVLTYQEQCMQAVVEVAGYSPGDSDTFRKVIAKKMLSKMPLHRKWFIDGRAEKDSDEYGKIRDFKPIAGGVSRGIDKSALEKFFDVMQEFGKYSFNKSHAAAYAYVCYITAWFMYYYPTEFMAANLSFLDGDAKKKKMPAYINYCRTVLNIEIVTLNVNASSESFVALKDGRIAYCLSVKGASEDNIKDIVFERENNGPFKTLLDFLIRCRGFLGKKTYEGLIGSGALSDFGIIKSQHLAMLDEFWDGPYKKAKDAEKRAIKSGKDFDFETTLKEKLKDIEWPDISEFPKEVALRLEKSLLGVYLTDNPLYKYAYSIKTLANFSLDSVDYEVDEDTGAIILSDTTIRHHQAVKFIGILDSVQEITTKRNTLMARLNIQDLSSAASCLVWADDYGSMRQKLVEDEIYLFTGYIMLNRDEPPTVVITGANEMDDVVSDRVIISVNNALDAKDIIDRIKADKFMQGQSPTYLKHGNTVLLLSKNFWVNSSYMKHQKDLDLEIQTW